MDWSDRIARRIKLRDLHILMAVADTGTTDLPIKAVDGKVRLKVEGRVRCDPRNGPPVQVTVPNSPIGLRTSIRT